MTTQVRVVEDYQAPYPNPIRGRAGDEVAIDFDRKTEDAGWLWCTNRSGQNGWVPAAYLDIKENLGRLRRDYDAIELTIRIGELLTVHEVESGFCWVTNPAGLKGWVPAANVRRTAGEL